MAQPRSAYVVIVGVTLLGIMTATGGIESVLPLILLGAAGWLGVRWLKGSGETVECQGCGIRMSRRRFRKGSDGWFDVRCPSCGSDLPPRVVK